MLKVKIQDKDYELCSEWSDITLLKFQELCRIPVPAKLKEKWEAWMSKKDAPEESHKEVIKIFPDYYGKVIALLSDIPIGVIKHIEWSLRDKLFNEYLLKFAVSVFEPQYEPVYAKSFKLNGEEFFFPETLERGGKIPLAKEDMVTFSEASDIEVALHEWADKGIDAMAQICAVYLRKEGERHSDDLVIQRTDQFRELPMSVVWEVFFCITRLGDLYKAGIEIYSKAVIQKLYRQQERQELVTSESEA